MEAFMNRLRQYLASLNEQWAKLTLNQKVIIAGALALVIIAIVIFSLTRDATSGYEALYTDLAEKDAAAIIEKLDEDKASYQITDNGTTIMVPPDQKYKTRLNLASQNLPRGDAGLEIFMESSFGETQTDKKVKYQSALQGELARTIQALDKVKAAKVNLALPEESLFSEQEELPKASVVVRTQDGESLSNKEVQAIINLVSNSIERLTTDNVVVVDQNGTLLSDIVFDNQSNTTEQVQFQLALKKQYEKEKENAIQTMLDKTLGKDNAVVRVSAELNFDNKEQLDEKYTHDPEGEFVRSEQSNKESTESVQNPSQQIPGTDSNIPQYQEIVGGDGESSSSKSEKTTNYEINRTETITTFSPGDVKYDYLTVSVLANNAVVANANLGQTEEERISKIRNIVATACGLREDRDHDNVSLEDNISVAFIDFYVEPVPEPRPISWFESFLKHPLTPIIFGVLAALLGLLIILSIRRKQADDLIEETGFEAIVQEEIDVEDLIDKTLTAEEKEQQKVKQEVEKLINEDPESAAQILRIWLSEDLR
ncbi:MAG TPA: flagellar basal-body MS-ring/collar protein FliF [Syntrophomonadaceae bacterium]|nr:flagellar basal-body MS-ring/collar protein FliF [Syntrophomonadaceae bacterium]